MQRNFLLKLRWQESKSLTVSKNPFSNIAYFWLWTVNSNKCKSTLALAELQPEKEFSSPYSISNSLVHEQTLYQAENKTI